MVAFGGTNSAGTIWALGDIGVGMTAWLNIIGILIMFFMFKPTMRVLKDYEEQKKAGVTGYTLTLSKLALKMRHFGKSKFKG